MTGLYMIIITRNNNLESVNYSKKTGQ